MSQKVARLRKSERTMVSHCRDHALILALAPTWLLKKSTVMDRAILNEKKLPG